MCITLIDTLKWYGAVNHSLSAHSRVVLNGGIMFMTEGQIFRCQDRHCGCEIRVVKASTEAKSNPRCCCGSEMKKPYTKPALRILNSNIESFASLKSNRD
jgi:hypothetical protein